QPCAMKRTFERRCRTIPSRLMSFLRPWSGSAMTFRSRGRIFFFVTLGRMPLDLPSPYSPTELLFSLLERGERQMRSESASARRSKTICFLKHLKRSFSQFEIGRAHV